MSKDIPQRTALSLRIPPQLKADLEALAAADNRSLSNFVQKLLREAAERQKPKRK